MAVRLKIGVVGAEGVTAAAVDAPHHVCAAVPNHNTPYPMLGVVVQLDILSDSEFVGGPIGATEAPVEVWQVALSAVGEHDDLVPADSSPSVILSSGARVRGMRGSLFAVQQRSGDCGAG